MVIEAAKTMIPIISDDSLETDPGTLLAWSYFPKTENNSNHPLGLGAGPGALFAGFNSLKTEKSSKIGLVNLSTNQEYGNFDGVKLQNVRGNNLCSSL